MSISNFLTKKQQILYFRDLNRNFRINSTTLQVLISAREWTEWITSIWWYSVQWVNTSCGKYIFVYNRFRPSFWNIIPISLDSNSKNVNLNKTKIFLQYGARYFFLTQNELKSKSFPPLPTTFSFNSTLSHKQISFHSYKWK